MIRSFTNAKFPCYGCADRSAGCHACCQKYADAKSEYEKYRNITNGEKRKYFDVLFRGRKLGG